MGSVTGFTAERMQQIEDETVIDGTIVGEDLVLTRRDGTEIVAGVVVGPQGPAGAPGSAADFAGYVEPIDDKGNVSGAVSLDLSTHNIWRLNPTAPITISFANLPTVGVVAPGTIILANSTHAITWPGGTKFPGGAAPVLDGETWLSFVAFSTHVVVGAAWSGVA